LNICDINGTSFEVFSIFCSKLSKRPLGATRELQVKLANFQQIKLNEPFEVVTETSKNIREEIEHFLKGLLETLSEEELKNIIVDKIYLKIEKKIDSLLKIANQQINSEMVNYAKSLELALYEEKLNENRLNALYKYLNK
jgi:DNA-directed RNA polymerase beta' subunit